MTDEQWYFLQKLLDPLDLENNKDFVKDIDAQMGLFYHHAQSPEVTHQIIHANEGFFIRYAPWVTDKYFRFIYMFVRDYSLLDLYRLFDLYTYAKQCKKVPGCFLEVGVANGGSGALLSAIAKDQNKKCYLADTWEGVVKSGEKDTTFSGGEFDYAETEVVLHLLSGLNTLNNTHLLKGIFPDETADKIDENISLIHVDVDTYQSCKDVFEWAKSKMSIGGVIVFDDYGFLGLEGVTRFANELMEDPNYIYSYNLNGHATFVKIKD